MLALAIEGVDKGARRALLHAESCVGIAKVRVWALVVARAGRVQPPGRNAGRLTVQRALINQKSTSAAGDAQSVGNVAILPSRANSHARPADSVAIQTIGDGTR